MNNDLNIFITCSVCNQLIPEHEIDPKMLNMDVSDLECIDCEMKYRDSADIDMFGGKQPNDISTKRPSNILRVVLFIDFIQCCPL